jgi:hypothetical protein
LTNVEQSKYNHKVSNHLNNNNSKFELHLSHLNIELDENSNQNFNSKSKTFFHHPLLRSFSQDMYQEEVIGQIQTFHHLLKEGMDASS